MRHRTITIVILFLLAGAFAFVFRTLRSVRIAMQDQQPATVLGLRVAKPVLDAGIIPPDMAQSLIFQLENVGRTVVRIREITSDCGCVVVDPTEEEISPGSSLALPVMFSPPNGSGSGFERNIVVRLEVGNQSGSLRLKVRGTVARGSSWRAFPGALPLDKVMAGTEKTRIVHLLGPAAALPAVPTTVHVVAGRDATIQIAPDTDPPTFQKQRDVAVTVEIPKDFPAGPWHSVLRLSAGPSLTAATIEITGTTIAGSIVASPPRLFIQLRPDEESTKPTVEFENLGTSQAEYVDVACPVPLELEPMPSADDARTHRFRVKATLRAGQTSGEYESIMRFHVRDGEDQVVRVPIFVSVLANDGASASDAR